MNSLVIRDPSDGTVRVTEPAAHKNLAAISLGRAVEPEKAIDDMNRILGQIEVVTNKMPTASSYYSYSREEWHERMIDAAVIAKQLKEKAFPEIRKAYDDIMAIVNAPHENKLNRAMICLMLGGLPSAKNFESRDYVDLAVWVLATEPQTLGSDKCGFGPTLVGCAIRDILRSATFAPPQSELIKAVRAQRSRFLAPTYRAIRVAEEINSVINHEDSSTEILAGIRAPRRGQ